MITTIMASGALMEALSFWMTWRRWSKMLSAFSVDVQDLSPEDRERATETLSRHYITSSWP